MMRPATLLLLAMFCFGCTDVIELETDFQTPEIVVDAWLTNQSAPQEIRLSLSQDYYDNRRPTGVTDAEVIVCRTAPDNRCFNFVHQDSGRYLWTPSPGDSLGAVDAEFVLGIQRGTESYGSQATIKRVPDIDSLVVNFQEEQLGQEAGLYAELYARDFPGTGDVYLTRTYYNDTLLLRPFELNLIYDGTFDAGSRTDGLVFISPIRQSINPRDDSGAFLPLQPGDELRVELWSVSQAAYFFLGVARDQLQNGSNGIFQIPVANAPGNVFNLETEGPVLGLFNIAAVSTATRRVEE
ncbi:DUF4249 domain-containing protein [Neolewinella litorea]|uniref:DUF4249 domain-containing protein n=1 Tax=Neolewinella litorea TaxID=2562452 RepID=A0A4S4NHN7_9BACT|nr:DUF4249 domain-containing protein [Neolewinella litorea]THH37718.1 DUF4249 domain-containing protein [Neolewinella litorea]